MREAGSPGPEQEVAVADAGGREPKTEAGGGGCGRPGAQDRSRRWRMREVGSPGPEQEVAVADPGPEQEVVVADAGGRETGTGAGGGGRWTSGPEQGQEPAGTGDSGQEVEEVGGRDQSKARSQRGLRAACRAVRRPRGVVGCGTAGAGGVNQGLGKGRKGVRVAQRY